MSSFEGQSSDKENAKAPPKSVDRDSDCKSKSLGSTQAIARKPQTGQQNESK